MKSLDEMFDHPCKDTCSGWQQGFDKANIVAQKEIDRLKKHIENMSCCCAGCTKHNADIGLASKGGTTPGFDGVSG